MQEPNNHDNIKREEQDDDQNQQSNSKKGQKEEWKCLDCKKSYKSYPAFYTHNKLKHDGKPPQNYDIPRSLEDIRKDRGRPRVTDSSQRIKFTIQDKHQQKCEDNIYEFLGKLGQKGDENGQRDNTVIRGYLKKPLDPGNLFPLDLFAGDPPLQDHAKAIKQHITLLTEELQKRDEWEFVDPLDLKPDDMSEFSIYNLKALFFNLREQGMVNSYTTLVVYLTWVSKELLEKAYREIVVISLNYCAQYWEKLAFLKSQDSGSTSEEMSQAIKKLRNKHKEEFNYDSLYQKYKLELFSEKIDIEQYIEKFIMWYHHFDDNESDKIENNHEYGDDDEDDEGEDIEEDEGDEEKQQGQVNYNQPGDSTTNINNENGWNQQQQQYMPQQNQMHDQNQQQNQ